MIQSISLNGKPGVPNDDRAGCGDRHAWVIDGATDLGPPGLVGARGGAAWLAATAHQAFQAASGPLAEICAGVFDTVAVRFEHDRQRDVLADWELPSAALAAVALEGDRLACAFLFDCTVIHRSANGVAYLTPAPDRVSERTEAEALGPGAGAASVRSEAVLADRRAARERPRQVLSVDADRARAAVQYAYAAVAPGDDILLMTDGFAALIETYDAYDKDSLIQAMLDGGLAALAGELRGIEHDDAGCLRYPRFKVSDDATAIWLRVG
ncbi:MULTISPECIES: protein phosphatase 2C domain-containing protein [Asticcacaulis]|uniref:protein phosphatase 2C domain-containing protein n=1 Tax=Asticcacaulis TaxID=76890 RepID=UPI001AE7509C|nr:MULTISPECIES: protein phosphatase 2C domain-containing protein [Asticcacaulis]MBP2158780.1 hypothetical protein [Asticcacaulis solisilvae]MDR6799826.1 hypothetical protein [Asticcacaulis sp. BE141]